MNFNKNKAQIMLMTLLVMSIIAVIIIGVLNLISRDVLQVTSSRKFEEALNVAEINLNDVVKKYGDPDMTLDPIVDDADFPNCVLGESLIDEISYDCEFTNASLSGLNLATNLKVYDTKNIDDYDVAKDQTLTVNLSGYNQTLEISWTEDYAMEVTLLARDASNNYITISDLFDRYSVFDAKGDVDPIIDSANRHDFAFQSHSNPTLANNGFRINISATVGLGGYIPQDLILTPRSKVALQDSQVTIRPNNYGSFPYQLRIFESKGFDSEEVSTPVASVFTKISLTPQTDSIFNYSLITRGSFSL